MVKFIQLAEVQNGHTTEFYYSSRQGKLHCMEISVHAGCAMIHRDNKYIGSVYYDPNTGKYTPMGWSSIAKKWIQNFIDETEREDSLSAPAWKKAIVDRYQKRVNDAQLELALAMKVMSNI